MTITVIGDNAYQAKLEVESIIQTFVATHGSLAVEQFSGSETDSEQIFSAVSNFSLLSTNKLVVINDFDSNKALTENTKKLVESVPDETTLLIVIAKLDNRAAYGKLLKKITDFRTFSVLSPKDLLSWIQNTAKDMKGSIDPSSARYLIENVGTDQQRLYSELSKLMLHSPVVTIEAIDVLCEREPSSTIFDLLDAGFQNNKKKAIDIYEELRLQQVEPLAIISMIGWQLHILSLIKSAKDVPSATIASDAGIHPFVVQKSQILASRMQMTKLKSLIKLAIDIEIKLKSQPVNADDALKHFLLSL